MTWKAPDVERPGGPSAGPERPLLQAFLDWHRATLLYKCAGLTGEQLAEHTVPPSGLSLLGLIRHMTKVERTWFRQRFAGEQVDPRSATTRRPTSSGSTRTGPPPTTPG